MSEPTQTLLVANDAEEARKPNVREGFAVLGVDPRHSLVDEKVYRCPRSFLVPPGSSREGSSSGASRGHKKARGGRGGNGAVMEQVTGVSGYRFAQEVSMCTWHRQAIHAAYTACYALHATVPQGLLQRWH